MKITDSACRDRIMLYRSRNKSNIKKVCRWKKSTRRSFAHRDAPISVRNGLVLAGGRVNVDVTARGLTLYIEDGCIRGDNLNGEGDREQ